MSQIKDAYAITFEVNISFSGYFFFDGSPFLTS